MAKITGMILDWPDSKVLGVLMDDALLEQCVQEALAILHKEDMLANETTLLTTNEALPWSCRGSPALEDEHCIAH